MDISERIKLLRKDHLGMSQDEFGKALGVSRDVIGNIEYDRLKRPDQKEPIYRLICSKFSVSEEWLRYGTGDIFAVLSRDEQITDFMADLLKEEDTFKKRLISALAELNEDEWELLAKIAAKTAKKD